jgi:superfamily II DNA/RNA helicase
MQDYVRRLLSAINNFDYNDTDSVSQLRDLVCWISDNETMKKDPIVSELLYIASQKMRVFGYNFLNHFYNDPDENISEMQEIKNHVVKGCYRSRVNDRYTLDKSQKEVVELFQNSSPRRLLVSAPTSYGKTFLLREIIFLNKERYHNILLVFPTVALLLENARTMKKFVSENHLNYKIIKTVDSECEEDCDKIFVFTPERALQLISSFPNIKLDFFFFDEIYKIDEDYYNNENDDNYDDSGKTSTRNRFQNKYINFLDEDRGKTFRIALYLLSKSVDEYYLAGPNLGQKNFGFGMKQYIEKNNIRVKEIFFEPTLRISVNAYNSKLEEHLPPALMNPLKKYKVSINTKVNDRIKDVVSYIGNKNYGKTLLYCSTPSKATEYSNKLSVNLEDRNRLSNCPQSFISFIEHIKNEYDIDNSSKEWSLVKVFENGFGIHHGKLPKYIQQEILEQFNNGAFNILFCTSTIVEGVNTDAHNMIILNTSKGRNKLTPFDIKNIKGRAGRYYHCFIGRVFYMNQELIEIENSEMLSLDFATYSQKPLGAVDLDNADYSDLSEVNSAKKKERYEKTKDYLLDEETFKLNRTIKKENQEKLLRTLMDSKEYSVFYPLMTHTIDVENFLKYSWTKKILNAFYKAELLDELTFEKYWAIALSYYKGGFKSILKFEIDRVREGKTKTIDIAYSNAFKSLRDILEHKIPKLLLLFESVIVLAARYKGDDVESFSLSSVRRYYETGVKSLLGEALIEYGFPTDAIRRLEDNHKTIIGISALEAKSYCREHYKEIMKLLDEYERQLFIKIMKTL